MSDNNAPLNQLMLRMTGQPYDRALVLSTWPDCPLDDLETLPVWLSVTFGAKNETDGIDVLGWRVHSLQRAFAPRPPLEYLIEGTYYLPGLVCLYAPPGALKTMMALDQAVCIAGGLDWLIPLPGKDIDTARKTRQTPVFWVDCDNGERAILERLEALARARNLTDAPLYYTCMPSPWLNAHDWHSIRALGKRVKALGAKFVVLDNLRNISGGVDENSADMGTVMANLRRLVEDTQAVVEVIHHQRKGGSGGGRAGDALRGHSSIEAALDLALLVERDGQSDSVTIKATKTRGADVLPFGAYFAYSHKPGTVELEEARFFGVESEGVVTQATIRRAITRAVENRPGINQSKLIDVVREALQSMDDKPPAKNRVRDEILGMVNRGKLKTEAGERNAILYHPPTIYDEIMAK